MPLRRSKRVYNSGEHIEPLKERNIRNTVDENPISEDLIYSNKKRYKNAVTSSRFPFLDMEAGVSQDDPNVVNEDSDESDENLDRYDSSFIDDEDSIAIDENDLNNHDMMMIRRKGLYSTPEEVMEKFRLKPLSREALLDYTQGAFDPPDTQEEEEARLSGFIVSDDEVEYDTESTDSNVSNNSYKDDVNNEKSVETKKKTHKKKRINTIFTQQDTDEDYESLQVRKRKKKTKKQVIMSQAPSTPYIEDEEDEEDNNANGNRNVEDESSAGHENRSNTLSISDITAEGHDLDFDSVSFVDISENTELSILLAQYDAGKITPKEKINKVSSQKKIVLPASSQKSRKSSSATIIIANETTDELAHLKSKKKDNRSVILEPQTSFETDTNGNHSKSSIRPFKLSRSNTSLVSIDESVNKSHFFKPTQSIMLDTSQCVQGLNTFHKPVIFGNINDQPHKTNSPKSKASSTSLSPRNLNIIYSNSRRGSIQSPLNNKVILNHKKDSQDSKNVDRKSNNLIQKQQVINLSEIDEIMNIADDMSDFEPSCALNSSYNIASNTHNHVQTMMVNVSKSANGKKPEDEKHNIYIEDTKPIFPQEDIIILDSDDNVNIKSFGLYETREINYIETKQNKNDFSKDTYTTEDKYGSDSNMEEEFLLIDRMANDLLDRARSSSKSSQYFREPLKVLNLNESNLNQSGSIDDRSKGRTHHSYGFSNEEEIQCLLQMVDDVSEDFDQIM